MLHVSTGVRRVVRLDRVLGGRTGGLDQAAGESRGLASASKPEPNPCGVVQFICVFLELFIPYKQTVSL